MTGFERADGYIADANIPADLIDAIKAEGRIRANMLGFRYADAVEDACHDYTTGRADWQTYTKRNAGVLRAEQDRRDVNVAEIDAMAAEWYV